MDTSLSKKISDLQKELVEGLALKSNKAAVATALHKKSNKSDIESTLKGIEEKIIKNQSELNTCLETISNDFESKVKDMKEKSITDYKSLSSQISNIIEQT